MDETTSKSDQVLPIPEAKAKGLRCLLALATVLLAGGMFLPMITISKFIVVRNSFSVMSGVLELLRNGQILLFVVVAGFSIVLPAMKIWVLFKLLSPGQSSSLRIQRYLHLMHEYGRWAMLDVMVVAVLIVTVKLGAIASIEVHYGLYVFGAAVVLIMLITNRVASMAG